MSDPRILYITGWTRSGSTLLGNVLGELPGVLHIGELRYLWQNGILAAGTNSLCGCGTVLTECPVWSAVLAEDGDRAGAARTEAARTEAARTMVRRQRELLRTRHTRARLAEADGAAPALNVEDTVGRTADIYRRLARHGAEQLIVDGSKYPAEAAALLRRSDLDVRILHIVRDPRATAFSYKRAKDYIDPMNPARSSGFWTAFNVASELVGRTAGDRYLRVRHEDLCHEPREVVARVIRFAGLANEPPVDENGRVTLGTNHTVTGNPDRLGSGAAVIRADERWRTQLTRGEIAAATVPALPMLTRYGYPLVPSR